jgi:phosphatidylglycerophosphate synthase
MDPSRFAGADKVNQSLLAPLERRLAPWVVPRIPRGIETYHLTALTLVWCAGILAASVAAARDRRWLWAASAMVVLQWVTDHFDGKLGKYRGTGLVRWGFYVDHFLDYVFVASILIGWSFVLPPAAARGVLILLAVAAGFAVHVALLFGTTGAFHISAGRIGPTELRVGVVVVNAQVVRYGTHGLEAGLPYAAAIGAAALAWLVFRSQRQLWRDERRIDSGV